MENFSFGKDRVEEAFRMIDLFKNDDTVECSLEIYATSLFESSIFIFPMFVMSIFWTLFCKQSFKCFLVLMHVQWHIWVYEINTLYAHN